jgi:hypothetical protein
VILGLGGSHEAAGIHHPCRWRRPFASRQARRLPATVCILIPMDWLILILGVPAILIPLVLLFGFAGCTPAAEACIDDSECPAGLVCFQNACVSADTTSPPPSPPDSLTANARDDQSVSLTWTEADPAVTDFEIERIPEAGEPGRGWCLPSRRIFPPPARPARRMRRRTCRRASHTYTAFGRCWESNTPTSRPRRESVPRSFPQPRGTWSPLR